jgi:hypothetical protein
MFQNFQAHVEKQFGSSICILCNDEGGEYTFEAFCNYHKQHNIHQQFTQLNTLHQNGVVE